MKITKSQLRQIIKEEIESKDPSWKNQASDKDFLILGQATSGDFNYHTMRHGDEPINLVFIKSVANNTEPIYAYVRY